MKKIKGYTKNEVLEMAQEMIAKTSLIGCLIMIQKSA